MKEKMTVPVWEKELLTVGEAADYYGIGENKIRELTKGEHNPYVLWVGHKRLIKRKKFSNYIDQIYSV